MIVCHQFCLHSCTQGMWARGQQPFKSIGRQYEAQRGCTAAVQALPLPRRVAWQPLQRRTDRASRHRARRGVGVHAERQGGAEWHP